MSRTSDIGETITGSTAFKDDEFPVPSKGIDRETAYRTLAKIEPKLLEKQKEETPKERLFFLAKVIFPWIAHFIASFWLGLFSIATWSATFITVIATLMYYDIRLTRPTPTARQIVFKISWWFWFLPYDSIKKLINWIRYGNSK